MLVLSWSWKNDVRLRYRFQNTFYWLYCSLWRELARIFTLSVTVFFFSFSQVGLAVGDIESVQKYAFLRNKGKFVDFVVGVERNLPKFVTRRLHKPELVVTGRYVDRKISLGWVSSYWGADRVFWLWLLLRLFERKAQSPSTVLGRIAFDKTTTVHDQLLLLSSSQKLFRRIKLNSLRFLSHE